MLVITYTSEMKYVLQMDPEYWFVTLSGISGNLAAATLGFILFTKLNFFSLLLNTVGTIIFTLLSVFMNKLYDAWSD